jgi:hypothetical protein
MPEQEEELFASQPADFSTVTPVTHYRSTWIVSSQDCVRSTGMFEQYRAALRRIDREEVPGAEDLILSAVANTWVPIAIARAHYLACDALGLSDREVLAALITADGGQVRRTWHAQIIAAAQKPDAAPWQLLPQIPKMWPRTAQGGGLAVFRLGPQQARIEYRACPLFDSTFYRYAVRAVLFIFVGHFCRDLVLTPVSFSKQGNAAIQLLWR